MIFTEEQLLHAFPEVLWQESVEEGVYTGVEVGYQEGERCEERAKVAGTFVTAGPVLPHLAGVEGQVADGEGEDDHDEHAHDAAARAQHVARQVAQVVAVARLVVAARFCHVVVFGIAR